MHSIGNNEEEQSKARDGDLEPSQVASDEDGAVVGKGTNVVWKIGNPAAAIFGCQVLKASASTEKDVETAFADSQAEFGLLVKGCPLRQGFIKPARALQH